MREILFRGKRKDNGEWIYGDLLHDRFLSSNKAISRIWDMNSNRTHREDVVIPETIGQYTDLADKNGKKIFEGDILKVKSMWHAEFPEDDYGFFNPPIKKETYWSVEYKNFCGKMGFMLYGIDRRWNTPLTWNKLYNAEAVVVGNIHDNPELMQRKGDTDGEKGA